MWDLARWTQNIAPSQSDLEVLSLRSTWDIWAFIVFFVVSIVRPVMLIEPTHFQVIFWWAQFVCHSLDHAHVFSTWVCGDSHSCRHAQFCGHTLLQSECQMCVYSLRGRTLDFTICLMDWFMCVLWVIGEWTWGHQCYLFTRDVGHAETWCHGHRQFRCGACVHWTLCEASISFVCTKLRNHCSSSGGFCHQFRYGCCRFLVETHLSRRRFRRCFNCLASDISSLFTVSWVSAVGIIPYLARWVPC